MRYFLGFLIFIGLIILAIIFLIRLIFGGGGGTPEPKTELLEYARSNKVMRLTIDGPINSEEEHRRIQFQIGQNMNELFLIEGYQNDAARMSRQEVASNPEAYANFLRAIDLQGYTLGNDSAEMADERGYCPQGNRYVFEIIDGSETLQRYWDTSCRDARTFEGKTAVIVQLFKAQFPDYFDTTSNFGLQ